MSKRVPMIVHVEIEGKVYSATWMALVRGTSIQLRADVGRALESFAREATLVEVQPLELQPVAVDLRKAALVLVGVDDELAEKLLAHAESLE